MSYLLFLCLVGLFYLTQANDCVGMDKAYIDKCLRDKIFLKATKEYLDSNGLVRISIKVDMSGYVLINRTIAIQTRTCSQEKSIARIVGREIDGVYIDYSNKETTYCPLVCILVLAFLTCRIATRAIKSALMAPGSILTPSAASTSAHAIPIQLRPLPTAITIQRITIQPIHRLELALPLRLSVCYLEISPAASHSQCIRLECQSLPSS